MKTDWSELGKAKESFILITPAGAECYGDSDYVLRTFVSAEHEKRIADFKALDDRVSDLTRDYIRASLCANLPDQDDSLKNSEC